MTVDYTVREIHGQERTGTLNRDMVEALLLKALAMECGLIERWDAPVADLRLALCPAVWPETQFKLLREASPAPARGFRRSD